MTDNPQYVADRPTRKIIATNIAITGLLLLLMMLFGLWMRLAQGDWAELEPDLFYQIMTMHGMGMIGLATLGGMSIMWYFLGRYVQLNWRILVANLVFFLVGVVLMLWAVFIGEFGGAWTFLYPLPAVSGGAWEGSAAFTFLFGTLLVGVGFLLVCLEVCRGLIATYGGLLTALGWPYLFGVKGAEVPPKAVVAAAMAATVDGLAMILGAFILILSMVNIAVPSFTFDPLFAKNVIYFFGHTIANVTIYMAVIAVYELLPVYARRDWKPSRVFVAGWMGSTIMVLVIFPHHLMMDLVMPAWVEATAQVLSYTNSFPVLVVTGFGAVAVTHRSGIRWDMVSGLLFLSMFGWMAGVIPAVIDATIVMNSVMHNTLWVPGHFHFYMLLGAIPMMLAFMYHMTRRRGIEAEMGASRWLLWLYIIGGLGFVAMFLYGGRSSVPRRWAEHLAEWQLYDRIASVFIVLIVVAVLVFVLRFLARLPRFLADG